MLAARSLSRKGFLTLRGQSALSKVDASSTCSYITLHALAPLRGTCRQAEYYPVTA